MFRDRLKKIMSLLEVTGKQLAQYIDLDLSGVSRMVSGGRVPARTGKTVKKLIWGICDLAQEKGKMDALRQLIGCEDEKDSVIQEALATYLYSEEGDSGKDTKHQKKLEGDRIFGERFDALMKISSFSNARFARLVNMDASYISRFRSGLRSAKSSPENVDRICRTFLERIQKIDGIEELSHTTGIDKETLGTEDGVVLLRDWLCGEPDENEMHQLQSLITDIISLENKYVQLPEEEITYEIHDCYIGQQSFQQACFRLLMEAVADGTKDLYFYDDASTAWIDNDPVFRRQWAFCMGKCLAKGIRIHIIHNIDKEVDELVNAIANWLPLYLSGLIESFYCVRERNRRFSNTLFMSDKAVVEGSHVSGYKKDRMYRYHTDPVEVGLFHEQFNALKEQSRELVRPLAGLREPLSFESHVKVVRNTLSISTMPYETLVKVMDRNDTKEADRERIVKEWQAISSMFDRAVLTGTFEEFSILDPGMNLDILTTPLKYDPETYAEHMEEIIRRLKQYPGYRFYALPKQFSEDCRIGMTEHTLVMTRLKHPNLTFYLSHPRVIHAFDIFLAGLEKKEYNGDRLREYLDSVANNQ